jgi:PAS domain S-box-containing protein
MISSVPRVALWQTSADGKTLHGDDFWRDYTGLSVEDGADFGWLKAVHPEERDVSAKFLAEHSVSATPFRVELRLLHNGGGYRRNLIVGAPRFDGDGAFAGYHGSAVDIDDMRRLQQRLRETEKLNKLLMSAHVSATFETTASGDVVKVSRSWGAATGQSVDDMLGFGWLCVIHPDERDHVEECWRRALSACKMLEIEFRVRRSDGCWRWVQFVAAPMLSADGSVHNWSAMVADVHDRREAEEAWKKNELQQRILFESIVDPFAQIDMTGRFVATNEAYRNMLGYSESELASMTFRDVTPERWHSFEEDIIQRQVLSRGYSDTYEKEYRHKNGTILPVELRAILQRDAGGAPLNMWGIVKDISARKAIENEMRALDVRKDEFLATLAHELRNPLAPIHNGIQALQTSERTTVSGRGSRMLSIMERQSSHLVRLLDDLMEVSRIRLGKLELHKEAIDVGTTLRTAIDGVRLMTESRGQRVMIQTPPEDIIAVADPTRLSQVFLNILTNASKFSPEGGSIWARASAGDGVATISIRDNGPGMTAQVRENVFNMFAQGEKGDHRGAGLGIGLALALAAKLVHMHGGEIKALSEGPGKGSEFVITLPLRAAPEATAASEPVAAASACTKRVLVIDDETDVADTLRFLLEDLGAKTRVAYDGEAGIDLAAHFRPDIILVDLGMPGLNGLDVCRRLRDCQFGSEATIVALTGWGQEEDRLKTKENGFDLHLTKPAQADTLRALLEGKIP